MGPLPGAINEAKTFQPPIAEVETKNQSLGKVLSSRVFWIWPVYSPTPGCCGYLNRTSTKLASLHLNMQGRVQDATRLH